MPIIEVIIVKTVITIGFSERDTLYDLIDIVNRACIRDTISAPAYYINKNRRYQLYDLSIPLILLGIKEGDKITTLQKKNTDDYCHDLSVENIAHFNKANYLSSTDKDQFSKLLKENVKIDEIKRIIGDKTALDLQDSHVSFVAVRSLAKVMMTNSKLVLLNLKTNFISDQGVKEIMAALKVNPQVSILNLGFNSISDMGAEVLAKVLEVNQSITILNLGMNCITDEGVKLLAKALIKNHTLTALDLWFNIIGNEGARFLVAALKINTSLRVLELGDNDIANKWLKQIDISLERNRYYHEQFSAVIQTYLLHVIKTCLLHFPIELITVIINYISNSEITLSFQHSKKLLGSANSKLGICGMFKDLFLPSAKNHKVDVVLINAILKAYEITANRDGDVIIKLDDALSSVKKSRLIREFTCYFQELKNFEVNVKLDPVTGFIILRNIKLHKLKAIEEINSLSLYCRC